jgi:hypothetical protein
MRVLEPLSLTQHCKILRKATVHDDLHHMIDLIRPKHGGRGRLQTKATYEDMQHGR